MAKKKIATQISTAPPMSHQKPMGALTAAREPRGEPIVVVRYFHYAGENVIWFKDCRDRDWIKYPTSDPVSKQLIQDAFATRAFRVTAFVFGGDDGPEASAVSIQTPP